MSEEAAENSMNTKQHIKPTAKQLEYQSWEFGLFIHFGLRTFYEGYVDFDDRQMSPEIEMIF